MTAHAYSSTAACFLCSIAWATCKPLAWAKKACSTTARATSHELSLKLWDARPLLLSSTVATNNFLFTADLANLDVL